VVTAQKRLGGLKKLGELRVGKTLLRVNFEITTKIAGGLKVGELRIQ